MEAGKLNRRVTILRKTVEENDYGEQTETWAALTTVWAAKPLLSTRDVAQTYGFKAISEGKFRIRYREDVRTTMRVTHGDETYEITGLEEYGNREGLDLFVKSVAL